MEPEADDPLVAIEKEIDLRTSLRGIFIEHVIFIENTISHILYYHFGAKQVRRQGLRRGVELLEAMLMKDYPEIYAKEPQLIPKLKGVSNFRNKLAHKIGASSGDPSNVKEIDRFIFVDLKPDGTVKQSVVTLKEFEAKEAEVRYIDHVLAHIQSDVIVRHAGKLSSP